MSGKRLVDARKELKQQTAPTRAIGSQHASLAALASPTAAARPGMQRRPHLLRPDDLLAMQRTVGNQAVLRTIAQATRSQPKTAGAGALIQRVLLHKNGHQLTTDEVDQLRQDFPRQEQAVDDYDFTDDAWIVTRGTKRLNFRKSGLVGGGGANRTATGGGGGKKRKAPDTEPDPVDVAQPRAKRAKKVNFKQLQNDAPDYFVKPAYGASNQYGGGTSMKATIGPGAIVTPSGAGSLAPIQTALRIAYPNTVWIQGHLLNDQLGGPDAPRNLTMLATGTNTAMTSVENAVRNKIYAAFNAINANAHYYYGAEYEVQVSGTPLKQPAPGQRPGQHPGEYVYTAISARAKSKKRDIHDITAPAVDTDASDPQALNFDIPWTTFPNNVT